MASSSPTLQARGGRAADADRVAKRIGRSAGAVSNCLARLAKAKKVRLAKKAPRAYVRRKARAW
jgi:hypothetical protein